MCVWVVATVSLIRFVLLLFRFVSFRFVVVPQNKNNKMNHSLSVVLRRRPWMTTTTTLPTTTTTPTTSVSFLSIRRWFSKYLSKSATKRLPLTTKQATKQGFTKGKGSTKEGRLRKGRFVVDPYKRLQVMVPRDLETFALKPYIAQSVSKWPPSPKNDTVST